MDAKHEPDSDDELAQELDSEPWDVVVIFASPPKQPHLTSNAELAVFSSRDLTEHIVSFVDSRYLIEFAAVRHTFYEAAQKTMRRRASSLLSETLPSTLAWEVEDRIYKHCNYKAGPGSYNNKLRQLVLNLKGNSALHARVTSGKILPEDLVHLNSDELRTVAAQKQAAHWKRAAAEAATRRPAPAHVVGTHRCWNCGCTRQWIRRNDKSCTPLVSEFLVCVSCCEEVPPSCIVGPVS